MACVSLTLRASLVDGTEMTRLVEGHESWFGDTLAILCALETLGEGRRLSGRQTHRQPRRKTRENEMKRVEMQLRRFLSALILCETNDQRGRQSGSEETVDTRATPWRLGMGRMTCRTTSTP